MTTIAWDGHILAADSQTTSGDSVALYSNKIMRLEDGTVFTGCGTLKHIHQLRRLLEEDLDEIPDDFDATCFHIGKNFFHRYEGGGLFIPMANFRRQKVTTGTGWEWAAAAMDYGCNAIQAVEYAKKKDIYTGGRVNYIEIIPRQPKEK